MNFRPSRPGKLVPPAPAPTAPPTAPPPDEPSVLWSGHLYDYSGYGKANREVLLRTANAMRVSVMKTGLEFGLVSVDAHTRARLDVFRDLPVRDRTPLLRFFGPDLKTERDRHRIVWTMMESYKIHPDMVRAVNENFDELWTPTEWNGSVFEESGVTIPRRVMPLGVNPSVYRPITGAKLPPCRRITGAEAGTVGVPEGFVFLSVGLPSFRKGFDLVAEAFAKAFSGWKDVHLVFGVTHSLPEWNAKLYRQFAGQQTSIWTLEGQYREHEMAAIYSAVNCYVSASRGEGWNLPVCEAAACGVPVIAPDNTSHPEVLGAALFMFPTESVEVYDEATSVSPWYRGVPFAKFGRKSLDVLVDHMRTVERGGPLVEKASAFLQARVSAFWTWDRVAAQVTERLMEVQP